MILGPQSPLNDAGLSGTPLSPTRRLNDKGAFDPSQNLVATVPGVD